MVVKVIVGNRVFTGKVVTRVYDKKKKIRVRTKYGTYEYDTVQGYIHVYIPESMKNKKLIIIAVDDSDIVKIDEDTILIKTQ